MFHRIYSFPFTFLQCFDYNIGKKEAFSKIKDEFRDFFEKHILSRFLKKMGEIFSENDEISAIYQFGSIPAPGNSNIDLIFITKDILPFFNNIIKIR